MMNPIELLNQIRTNPMQVLNLRYNIPQNVDMSNPQNIIQYLLNTNQISQEQLNQVMNMRNNPQIKSMFNIK